MKFSKKKFIILIIMAASCLSFSGTSFSLQQNTEEVSPVGTVLLKVTKSLSLKNTEHFMNEKVAYDIGYLWFKKAAESVLTFEREGAGFKATLKAKTKGFIGFLTSYRKHTYISHMTYSPDKKKMLVSRFERYVTMGKKTEKTITTLDYENRIIHVLDYKKGKLLEDTYEEIPEGMEYDDILSAFYNFRLGAFGAVERGRKFQVDAMPSEGKSTIDVHIKTLMESKQTKKVFGRKYDAHLLHVNIRVPEEMFKSKKGIVAILFGEEIIPEVIVVEDYIGFGDMVGVLRGDQQFESKKN